MSITNRITFFLVSLIDEQCPSEHISGNTPLNYLSIVASFLTMVKLRNEKSVVEMNQSMDERLYSLIEQDRVEQIGLRSTEVLLFAATT